MSLLWHVCVDQNCTQYADFKETFFLVNYFFFAVKKSVARQLQIKYVEIEFQIKKNE